jgi:hypothetical protein
LEPALTRSIALPCRPPRTSLSHCARTRGASSSSVPRLSSSSYLVRCPGEHRLLANNTRHPLVCPQPFYFPLFAITGLLITQSCIHRHRPRPSRCPRQFSNAPESSLEVTNPPMPLIPHLLFCCPLNRSPELMCATVGSLHRGPFPLVSLHRCRAHSRVRHVTPSSPDPFPSALDPRRGRALASGKTPLWSRAVSPWVAQQPSTSSPSNLGHPSEI